MQANLQCKDVHREKGTREGDDQIGVRGAKATVRGEFPKDCCAICECVLSTVAEEKNEDRDGTVTDKRQKGVQGSGNQT